MNKTFAALLILLPLSAAQASDFELAALPSFTREIDLKDRVGKTFYELMDGELKGLMNGRQERVANDELLRDGRAVALRLNERNVNMHVNYYDSPLSGRSYGWSQQTVGDWSDRTYLQNMSEVAQGGDAELRAFYSALVQLLGDCDPSGLSALRGMAERVATNFLAIYAAEEYRATLGTRNWDDALLETTLLAAFHAGQSKLTKFYMGEFTDRAYKQAPGVFNARGSVAVQPGEDTAKDADLTDYWQFSPNPQRRNSGINETRPDFEKMGEKITAYEKQQGNADVDAIEAIVQGAGANVIKDVSRYFTDGAAQAAASGELAAHVSSLMARIKADADEITKSVR